MLVQVPDATVCNVRSPAAALPSRNNVLQPAHTGGLQFSVRLTRAWSSIGSNRAPPLACFHRAPVLGATALQISTVG